MFNYLQHQLGGNPDTHVRRKMIADTATHPDYPGHELAKLFVSLNISMLCDGRTDDVRELFTETGLRDARLPDSAPL